MKTGLKLIANLAEIDQKAIRDCQIPALSLMETAGQSVAAFVEKLAREQPLKGITVICGKGNNGGDGFVSARHLAKTHKVTVIYWGVPDEMTENTRTNLNLLQNTGVTLIASPSTAEVEAALQETDILLDALFGSGLSRPIEGQYQALIQAINAMSKCTVSVDLPSGIDGRTGTILGIAVEADYTLTFTTSKPGLHLSEGSAHAGKIEIVEIGIPEFLIESDSSRVFLMTEADILQELPIRHNPSHKYSYGSVLIIAGSRNMPGAAQMAAEACLRSGAGIVILAAPASSLQQMQLLPEIIRLPLPETAQGRISMEAVETLRSALGKTNVVALGPGITTQPETLCFVEAMLSLLQQEFQGFVVLDADGLNCLSQISPSPVLSDRFILTPHLGECARLLQTETSTITQDLLLAAQKTAEKYQAITVLKSSSTVIYDAEERFWVNPTGNPGMATAGSGDILTGLIAGFAGQGLSTSQAARLGVYIHGLSGDKAAQALTQYCLIATDLIRYLPQALKHILAKA
jgi:ADP-dependent NAD(P)H-hydrate dehydratase / NAD(P)H-hydrate epimerase